MAESHGFQHFILAVILATVVIVGLETSETLVAGYGGLPEVADLVVQTIFVIEIAIRLLAHWPRPGRFLRDGWNVFDLAVMAASLLPQAGAFTMVARLARLMRVTRLSLPRARPGALEHAGRSAADPVPDAHAGGVVEVQAAVLPEIPFAWVYFASFVFVAVFVVVNLFIAVVLNNLEAAKVELQAGEDRRNPHHALLESIEVVKARLEELERQLREGGLLTPPSSPEGRGSIGS